MNIGANSESVSGSPLNNSRLKTPSPPRDSSEDLLGSVHLFIECLLLQVIALIGSFGNMVTMSILYRLGVKDATNMLLFSLAIFDFITLVTIVLRKFGCVLAKIDPVIGEIYQLYLETYMLFPGRLTLMISAAHVVIIAIERFIAVFFPFQASSWITPKRMFITVTLISASLAITSMYTFFIYKLEWQFDVKYNRTFPQFRGTEFYLSNSYIIDIIKNVIVTVLTGPVFNLIVLITSTLILFKLRGAMKRRLLMTGNQQDNRTDIKASRMLISVCLVYISVNTSSFILYLLFYYIPYINLNRGIALILNDIDKCLWACNSSANVVIYTLMSRKFYNCFIKFLLCK